jgi:hypothetical protein
MSEKNQKKVIISMSPTLYEALVIRAAQQGKELNMLIIECLEKCIKNEKPKPVIVRPKKGPGIDRSWPDHPSR